MITQYDIYKINTIVDYITEQTGIDIFEKTRKRDVVETRAILIYTLRKHHAFTYPQIQSYFQINEMSINHATCIHAVKSFPVYMKFNKSLERIYDAVKIDHYQFKIRKDTAKTIYEMPLETFKRVNDYIKALTYDEVD